MEDTQTVPGEAAQQVPEEIPAHEKRRDDTVYVGKKELMSYVLAVVTQFNQGAKEVRVKARGKAISRAVDVSQVVKSRFISNLQIGLGEVTTEELTSEDGRLNRVSSLTLVLSK